MGSSFIEAGKVVGEGRGKQLKKFNGRNEG